jgi:hypothetical protein
VREPHRVGEVAFLPIFDRRIVGRGDLEADKFAQFGRRRPGEPFTPTSDEDLLEGKHTSRRQLLLRPTADAVEMEVVGRCVTLVNGEERTSAVIKDGRPGAPVAQTESRRESGLEGSPGSRPEI